jgi:nucleosome binding factor SPN SPT16 subunit
MFFSSWSHFTSQEQEAIYNLLLSMQSEMLREIKDGVSAREVYQRALDIVKKEKPELEKNFVKNAGFGVSNLLSSKCLPVSNSFRPAWNSVILLICFLSKTLST